jgi:carbon starvation protein CstA
LFITLSCGAISGFHSTQSPIMARCIQNESQGRLVFYGAMIAEGVIALVWATAGMSFYQNPADLNAVIQAGSPSLVVSQVCNSLLGPVGGGLAILGVIVLPITSGDTAFRSTRLILAETFRFPQNKAAKRLMLAVPLFIVAFIISFQDFEMIWRYFGWSNQTLAMLVLWAAAIYLKKQGKCHWIASIPAAGMTAVSVSFILQAPIGFSLAPVLSNVIGGLSSLSALLFFLFGKSRRMTP